MDLDSGTAHPELGMLRVVKDTFWRFAEHRIPLASIYPVFHVKNYRTEARILDEFGPHALQKRTLKSGRKKKEKKSNADPRRESQGLRMKSLRWLIHLARDQYTTATGLVTTTFSVCNLC